MLGTHQQVVMETSVQLVHREGSASYPLFYCIRHVNRHDHDKGVKILIRRWAA